MWAVEHWGVKPDILLTAKGIASGMPIAALVARAELLETWGKGAHGSTYGGNPVACAAALATIELLEAGLVENSARVGAILKDRLSALRTRHSVIGDVRGLGLMIGVEFEKNDGSGAHDGELRDRIMQKCFEKGLLLLSCGESTLRFCPPLIVKEEEVNTAVAIFDAAISAAT
jgi:4-aminobutyrate aminotransferase